MNCSTKQYGDQSSTRQVLRSPGHTSEDETGLIYMRARYMDPALGRFISEDPARDGMNWYVYCRNNPVSMVDVDGKEATFAEISLSAFLTNGLSGFATSTAYTLLAQVVFDLARGEFSGPGSYMAAIALGGLGGGFVVAGKAVAATAVASGLSGGAASAMGVYVGAHLLALEVALVVCGGETIDGALGYPVF